MNEIKTGFNPCAFLQFELKKLENFLSWILKVNKIIEWTRGSLSLKWRQYQLRFSGYR